MPPARSSAGSAEQRNRRGLLAGAVGALGIELGSRLDQVVAHDTVMGTVARVPSDGLVVLDDPEATGPLRVRLAPHAEVRRDGPAALTDFRAGDEVAAEGEWRDDFFVATSFESVYHVEDSELEDEPAVVFSRRDGATGQLVAAHVVPLSRTDEVEAATGEEPDRLAEPAEDVSLAEPAEDVSLAEPAADR
jgi:hypothetical protein